MSQKTQHGYLILADIAGYTSYLAGVELTHAQEILTELLELLVERLLPLLGEMRWTQDSDTPNVTNVQQLSGY